MTYYEELGVSAKASEEEIRKSYRALSRILHPATQPEATLRKLAEAQMKRLGEVLETLCDDDLRANYDLRLAPQKDWRIVQPELALSRLALWATALAIVSLLFYEFWMILPPESQMLNTMTEVGPLILSSPAGSGETGRGEPGSGEQVPIARPITSFGLLPTDPALIIESARIPKKMDGIWVYAMDPRNKPAKWAYAAEYVELKLQERDGEVLGVYRSRYKIPDKPLHPELAFQFSGQTQKTEFEWSAGKLRGQIHLNLQQDNVMEASWKIIDEGSVAGLAAGSATLIRRLE